MKTSVWSSYFCTLSPEEMVSAFAAGGWTCSELSDEHASCLLDRGQADKTGRAFSAYAADHGVSFPQGHLWLRCDIAGYDRQNTIDRLKTWLDLFLAVGVNAAVLHPAGPARYQAGDDPEAIEAASVATLRHLAGYVEGTGLTICLENLYTHAASCRSLQQMITHAGGRHLGICLDTGHLNLAGRDQAGFIRQAGKQLLALHITDNQGQSDEHLLPFGPGNIDWIEVVRSLRQIGYAGLFNYEIPGERQAPLPVLQVKLDYIGEMTRLLFAEAEQA